MIDHAHHNTSGIDVKMSVAGKNEGFAALSNAKTIDGIFNPIKTRRAFDEISNEIKRLIFKGILKPGDRLPSETELANRFNVGRQTIREALRLLELSVFISMQKGGAGGPLVVDTILHTIAHSFLDAFQMGKISLNEHTKARIEIEKMVLNCVLTSIEESDVKCLQENIERARRKLENNEHAFEDNIQFHKLLARASKNHVFLVVMESITTVVSHIRSLLGMDPELSKRTVAEHEEILKAIIDKDNARALGLLEKHLSHVGDRYNDFFQQIKGEEENAHSNITDSLPNAR